MVETPHYLLNKCFLLGIVIKVIVIMYISSSLGTEAVIVKIPIPLKSEDEIVEAHRKALEENPKIKIAIIGEEL